MSGKSGGYYGCLAATNGARDNKTLVRRLVEQVILGAIQEQIADPDHIAYVLQRVEEEIAKLRSDLPDTLRLKETELTAEQRRLTNFVDFIGEGRGSQALAKAPRRDRAPRRPIGRRGGRATSQPREDLPARLPSSGSRSA